MHMPKKPFSKKNYEFAIFTRFYLTIGHLWVTVGHPRVTTGHLKATVVYIRKGNYRLFFSISKHEAIGNHN